MRLGDLNRALECGYGILDGRPPVAGHRIKGRDAGRDMAHSPGCYGGIYEAAVHHDALRIQ
ncbi:hypothetical protein ATER59S_02490 [Aquamicrobium terrae]